MAEIIWTMNAQLIMGCKLSRLLFSLNHCYENTDETKKTTLIMSQDNAKKICTLHPTKNVLIQALDSPHLSGVWQTTEVPLSVQISWILIKLHLMSLQTSQTQQLTKDHSAFPTLLSKPKIHWHKKFNMTGVACKYLSDLVPLIWLYITLS